MCAARRARALMRIKARLGPRSPLRPFRRILPVKVLGQPQLLLGFGQELLNLRAPRRIALSRELVAETLDVLARDETIHLR